MDDKMDICKKEIGHVKSLYRLHLLYIVIICAIIMVCTLCVIPNCVSDSAFQNFSFTSTIVSIVLAVVSIVYSLWSGQKSNSQYVGMAHIESKIDEQLKGFERIELSFANKINPLNKNIEQIKDDQTKTRQAMDKMTDRLGGERSVESHEKWGEYNIKASPAYADLSLYLFATSNHCNKPFSVKFADSITDKYWSGFMVAFSCSQSDKLNYKNADEGVSITTFSTDYFGTASNIKNRLMEKSSAQKEKIRQIDEAFGLVSSRSNTTEV